MDSKVSFTIRRPGAASTLPTRSAPSPAVADARPRTFTPHAADSSDEDDAEGAVEPVTAFDQSGAQRLHERPPPAGPLVIPALANRDWRAVARGRRQQRFVPEGAAAPTGADGSQGGLGTRDAINAGPQLAGLTMTKKESDVGVEGEGMAVDGAERFEESEDERARRALVAGAAGGDAADAGMALDAIPAGGNSHGAALDETGVYKQDVVTRPDSASLADYERVPVALFGAALLRGMGWTEGTAASRTRRGLAEPWLPAARPALLGLGAKERPAADVPGAAAGGKPARPERRYVPVVRLDREGPEGASLPGSPSRSGTVSRAASTSASPYPSDRDRDRRRLHRDRDRAYESGRERDRGRRGAESDRGERDRDRRRDGRSR